MSLSSPAAQAQAVPSPSSAGGLRFDGLWLFSPRSDAVFLLLPLALAMGAAAATSLGLVDYPQTNRLAIWTAQNVLGNGTHVILTFLLFAVHRDVVRATPEQPRQLLIGCLLTLGLGVVFYFTYYVHREGHMYALGVLFNVLGLHHTLSQQRGFWSLHGLRAHQAGLAPGAPRERSLQQAYVPLMLSLVLVRLFFVPDSADPEATPYIDVGQGAPLPHEALGVIIAVWLGYFVLLFRAVLAGRTASGPKVLYLFVIAWGTGLVLVAPAWGNVVLPGMHGLEYYMLTARMLEPREGDPPSRLPRAWIWPAMVLSMLPLLVLGVVDFLVEGPARGTLLMPDGNGDFVAHPLLHAAACLGTAVVLAHYVADAFIYRFRIPSIRQVMLRRMGFSAPAAPRGATPAASASP